MAKVNYYLINHGKLVRKANTVYFYRVGEKGIDKIPIPVKKIHAVYCLARIGLSSGVISYLSKHRVPVHFYNKYGVYLATLYPRKYLLSGYLLVRQALHHISRWRRLFIARQIVRGSIQNMIRNLEKQGQRIDLNREIELLKKFLSEVDRVRSVQELMGVEGNARHEYYRSFNKILGGRMTYSRRSRRPPETMLDALISFGNSLLYGTVLTEIYHTQLDPTISYLHQPYERRYSLALDIAEIFKPIIVDRVIFTLVNKKIIGEEDFRRELNAILLNTEGKRKFLKEYEGKLQSTVRHRGLGRKVSHQRLIRLECYKLIKHLLGTSEYRPLVAWW